MFNAVFDREYTEHVTGRMGRHIDSFDTVFGQLKTSESRLRDILSDSGRAQNGEQLLDIAQEIASLRFKITDIVRSCIYYVEMRIMPFADDHPATTRVSSIIDLCNSHASTLSGIDEVAFFKLKFTGDTEMVAVYRDLETVTHITKLLGYIEKFGYIMHNIQKAVHYIRHLPSEFQKNTSDDKPPAGMFS